MSSRKRLLSTVTLQTSLYQVQNLALTKQVLRLSQEHYKVAEATAETLKKIRATQVEQSVIFNANSLSPNRKSSSSSQESMQQTTDTLPTSTNSIANETLAAAAATTSPIFPLTTNGINNSAREATSTGQCNAAFQMFTKKVLPKFEPPYDGSEMAGVAVSALLQDWNKCGLNHYPERFASKTSSTNKTKIKQVVEYTYSVISPEMLHDLKADSPNPAVEPDKYRAWHNKLKTTAEAAQKIMMAKLFEAETAAAATKPPPEKKRRKLPEKEPFVFAVQSRINKLAS